VAVWHRVQFASPAFPHGPTRRRGAAALGGALAALWRREDTDEASGDLERQLLGPGLAAALGELAAADRDALLLLAWAELEYLEIAQALDVPVGTVRSRINWARSRVRAYLNEGNDDA
jgi:DNA-directed RNA polymerase specialized sigma24 family protein